MTYFCFIESSILSVPHMEPLTAEDPDSAATEAGELLAQHASGYAVHVFLGDQKIVTLRREPEGAAIIRGQSTPTPSRSASSVSQGTTT
ncbi:hypothetical protein GCM10009116_15770 [Brevundimonas basaltis]|uniref:Uncharacterized protein n=1 Tax=Brevundimonas basaltis TaxID=472166 RepID=A0A7W8HWA9_9CAUL|nr:hypothetical protein [Brevundimonas basaltis]MBB5291111.1 hypothetical protein [Brevundimonas basaltis]